MGALSWLARRWILLVIVLVALAAAGGGYYYYQTYFKVVPEELLAESLSQTLAAASYRYHIETRINVEGREDLLSRVDGERDPQGNFHIIGEITGQATEAYQLADTTYLKDPVTGKWMVIPGNDIFQQELFMAEINPLGSLQLGAIHDLAYLGLEDTDQGRAYHLRLRPEVQNKFLQLYAQDFLYDLWIGRRDKLIHQVAIQAASQANPTTTLAFSLQIYDYGARVRLEPPA